MQTSVWYRFFVGLFRISEDEPLKKKLNEFAALLSVKYSYFYLVTVKNQNYYAYRYEGKLNSIENTVVLLSYPEKAFGIPKALRVFLSTGVSLSTGEILTYYVCRWLIEIFFRQCKDKLVLDSYQIRSVILSGWKSIGIYFNVQRQATILIHL